ncbi:MAG: Gfo/Idh/MocA family oxidoreductase, partial [Puniceicoccales bacterium]|nr:Gfo/Idh/MocA family oxidoreductase [Puniceicoccales bacterium]
MRKHYEPTPMQRRGFLKGILAAGTFSMISPRSLWAADDEPTTARTGQKVRLACIGVGNQGAFDIGALHRTGLAEIVALCDTEIDGPRVGKTAGKPPNTAKSPMQRFAHVPRFQDFRKMFDKMANQIDAVLIATPDFSHFPAT